MPYRIHTDPADRLGASRLTRPRRDDWPIAGGRSLTRRSLLGWAGALPFLGLAGCGGGAEEGNGSAQAVQRLAATTLTGAALEIQRRYPPAIEPSLASELALYTATETAIFPGQTRSMIQGNWLGTLDRQGRTRVNDGALVNIPNTAYPSNADLRIGTTSFNIVDIQTGAGTAGVRNARDNLQLDNGDLQVFLGIKPPGLATGRFSFLEELVILTFGDVRDGPNGPIVGTSLSLWFGYLGASGVTSTGSSLNRFPCRYRAVNVRDFRGGPLGLRNDFDIIMARV